MNVNEIRNELEEVMKNNKVELENIEEIEDMIAPICGCGCGGMC